MANGISRGATNTTGRGSDCTAQMTNGRFCENPSMEDAPFPICAHHAIKLVQHMKQVIQETSFGTLPSPEERAAKFTARQMRYKEAVAEQSVVYYVRIHDYIKIGYTTNVKARMTSLRANLSDVLATEPGGRDLELERHRQFKSIRIGHKENFKPTEALMAHITAVREFHGEPNITDYIPSYDM